jgi:hypothetical protein
MWSLLLRAVDYRSGLQDDDCVHNYFHCLQAGGVCAWVHIDSRVFSLVLRLSFAARRLGRDDWRFCDTFVCGSHCRG